MIIVECFHSREFCWICVAEVVREVFVGFEGEV